VPDYPLLAEAGFQPLGFVTGSAAYHVGLPTVRRFHSKELQVILRAVPTRRPPALRCPPSALAFL
jgi:hypothetical protein